MIDETRIDIKISRAERTFQQLLDWSGRFDTRSAAVFGIVAGMLGFLATAAPPPSDWDCGCIVGTILTLMPLAISLGAIGISQFPQTAAPNDSHVYFGTIATLTVEQYFKNFCDRTDDQHLSDLCSQIHRNATLLSTKFKALKIAMAALVLAAAPWTFTIVWFRLVKP